MAIMMLPQNVIDGITCVNQLVDDIWYYAGDKSADVSYSLNHTSVII